MNEYYTSEEKENALAKRVRKTTKKWIIGNIIAALFGTVGILFVILIFASGGRGAEAVALSVAFLIVPVIGVLISLAVARSGGRDILLARMGEKVYLTDAELVESYTPRFKTVDAAVLVENRVAYSSITSITHEKECRYVICGDVKTVKYSAGAQSEVVQGDKIVLYDYFEDTVGLLANLTKYCNVPIKEEG